MIKVSFLFFYTNQPINNLLDFQIFNTRINVDFQLNSLSFLFMVGSGYFLNLISLFIHLHSTQTQLRNTGTEWLTHNEILSEVEMRNSSFLL